MKNDFLVNFFCYVEIDLILWYVFINSTICWRLNALKLCNFYEVFVVVDYIHVFFFKFNPKFSALDFPVFLSSVIVELVPTSSKASAPYRSLFSKNPVLLDCFYTDPPPSSTHKTLACNKRFSGSYTSTSSTGNTKMD